MIDANATAAQQRTVLFKSNIVRSKANYVIVVLALNHHRQMGFIVRLLIRLQRKLPGHPTDIPFTFSFMYHVHVLTLH